jgi:membrane protease YdiL (CAAX protease family)
VLWGLLARRTGSILPGMALHVVGDALVAFFLVLNGDASLLVAAS